MHIPKDERSKLDVKSKECIFLNYGDEKFGYKLYDPIERKMFRGRDVKFFEEHTIDDIKNKSNTEEYKDDLVGWESDDDVITSNDAVAHEHVETDAQDNQ
ncbi:hypothetical protein LIER_17867 [Lithospermum erythrorhizon]|uniref:Retroviral polymerase SH3-like domain-containing protein n=1 Tax=Lithospermum erythrorhizon TaxID=34254 RepID=A0AAV3QBT5_LITER